jgi:hypothetical protein
MGEKTDGTNPKTIKSFIFNVYVVKRIAVFGLPGSGFSLCWESLSHHPDSMTARQNRGTNPKEDLRLKVPNVNAVHWNNRTERRD